MKKTFIAVIALVLLSSFTIFFAFEKKTMEETLLRILCDPALEAIDNYYGTPRQYWEDKLLSVQKVSGTEEYEVVMQVETFYGAHDAPFGIETLTFHVSYTGVVLKNFEHQDKI